MKLYICYVRFVRYKYCGIKKWQILLLICSIKVLTNYIYTQTTPKDAILSTFVMSKMTLFWLFHTKQNMPNMFSSWFNVLHCLWLSFSSYFSLFLFFKHWRDNFEFVNSLVPKWTKTTQTVWNRFCKLLLCICNFNKHSVDF